MKILILKPSSLGDVVQALPVLRLLKRHWPESEIYWWIDSSLAPLLEEDPDLTDIVRFERRRWASPIYWPELCQSIFWARRQRFDLVIDLQCLARSGTFAWLARGELLVGLDEPREGARGFYDIIVPRDSFHTHAVDWYLAAVRALGVSVDWNFSWMPVRPAIAATVKQKWQPESSRWFILQPGARWMNKRWPVEHYAELAAKLTAAFPGHRLAILGSVADAELGKAIAQANPQRCLDLTGKVSLAEMVEWIRLSDLMISNDTGPMHVAAALGKPVVAPFGPTEPRRTGPYRQPAAVVQISLPCIPCMKPYCTWPKPIECLRGISADTMLARVQSQLNAIRAQTDRGPEKLASAHSS